MQYFRLVCGSTNVHHVPLHLNCTEPVAVKVAQNLVPISKSALASRISHIRPRGKRRQEKICEK